MPRKSIDTESFSSILRKKVIQKDEKRLLITRFNGSKQEEDFTKEPNCQGYGRIRHFIRETSPGWPPNPLPIDPAAKALGHPLGDSQIRAQAFQIAACNWRCWYCFVDIQLLSADMRRSKFLSTNELVELYRNEEDQPKVFDLTGGQPDLVPEWIPWMMEALANAGLTSDTYLWSDDNLSNDYFWRYLSPKERNLIERYPNYGKVCCFKGFDKKSFAFNTSASEEKYYEQFRLLKRLIKLDIDIYCYAIFTTHNHHRIQKRIKIFIDRLQDIHRNLPRRLVPLEVVSYTPIKYRKISEEQTRAMEIQNDVVSAWTEEFSRRYSTDELSEVITSVPL